MKFYFLFALYGRGTFRKGSYIMQADRALARNADVKERNQSISLVAKLETVVLPYLIK